MAKLIKVKEPITKMIQIGEHYVDQWESIDGKIYCNQYLAEEHDKTVTIEQNWNKVPHEEISIDLDWLCYQGGGHFYLVKVRNNTDVFYLKEKFPYFRETFSDYLGQTILLHDYEYETSSYGKYAGLECHVYTLEQIQECVDVINNSARSILSKKVE